MNEQELREMAQKAIAAGADPHEVRRVLANEIAALGGASIGPAGPTAQPTPGTGAGDFASLLGSGLSLGLAELIPGIRDRNRQTIGRNPVLGNMTAIAGGAAMGGGLGRAMMSRSAARAAPAIRPNLMLPPGMGQRAAQQQPGMARRGLGLLSRLAKDRLIQGAVGGGVVGEFLRRF